MSTFAVTLERVDQIRPHPGADRLDLATLLGKGYQLVVGRGQFKPGDAVVYFPVDAILPEPLQQKLNVAGRLAGRAKNRIKTIRLRGEISQGLIGSASLAEGADDRSPEGLTRFFGVTKYEPPEELELAGTLVPLPEGQPSFDVEAADNVLSVLSTLMDQNVHITEKIEGSNLSVCWRAGRAWVCQRNFAIEPVPGRTHAFWEVAQRDRLLEFVQHLSQGGQQDVGVWGELIGPKVQGNYYRVPRFRVLLFDLKLGARWVPQEEFRALVRGFFGDAMATVPALNSGVKLADWLAGRSLRAASEGPSQLQPAVPREGIVIRPVVEQFCKELHGRLILKQRSPAYLAETDR